MADGLEHLADELARCRPPPSTSTTPGPARHPLQPPAAHPAAQVGRIGDRLSERARQPDGPGPRRRLRRQTPKAGRTRRPRHAPGQRDQRHRLPERLRGSPLGKVQFLLDAMVGLISIAQNDIFKVLTIVSIVGIPPTLIASIYGMNFKNMPEYNWAWGYQYGLAMIVLSAVIPPYGSRSRAGSKRRLYRGRPRPHRRGQRRDLRPWKKKKAGEDARGPDTQCGRERKPRTSRTSRTGSGVTPSARTDQRATMVCGLVLAAPWRGGACPRRRAERRTRS